MPVESEVSAVSMMTSGASSICLIRLSASRPEMPVILMSSRTTSQSDAASNFKASSPLSTEVASMFRSQSWSATTSRNIWLSSTTSARILRLILRHLSRQNSRSDKLATEAQRHGEEEEEPEKKSLRLEI